MSRWSQDRSSILSLLLDGVVGTKELIGFRQDFCRFFDVIHSNRVNLYKVYWTGSKSEGLDLPGSDTDLMWDINRLSNLKVIHSLDDDPVSITENVFYMSTENTPPGFALLRYINPGATFDVIPAFQTVNGLYYLSSELTVDLLASFPQPSMIDHLFVKISRQGPSVEQWTVHDQDAESGTDNVFSILCDTFWPPRALEWIKRPRHFGWPSPHVVTSIVNSGFHLVPIGHPHSKTRSLEWRISFSLAERTLVWSFNHTQMQCYAVMKIILKEFIKTKCSQQNQILCSYFIKSFLFWEFERKDLSFWEANNFGECIKYLLIEFHRSLYKGVIKHYFFPTFNLLAVKLTLEAQTELLQLFDIVIQSDLTILRECETLKNVWVKFLSADNNQIGIIHNERRTNFLNNDTQFLTFSKNSILYAKVVRNIVELDSQTFAKTMLNLTEQENYLLNMFVLSKLLSKPFLLSFDQLIDKCLVLPCKTSLKSVIITQLLFEKCLMSSRTLWQGNKDVYRLHKFVNNEQTSFDLSTSKLWYAIILLLKRDYKSTLTIVKQVICSIPPFVLLDTNELTESSRLYVDKFINSDDSIIQRERKAWLYEFLIDKSKIEILPLAIQIEMFFCPLELGSMYLSPFICLFYLMFLCYNALNKYDNRDRALRQLVDVANHCAQSDLSKQYNYNITGHCLLIAGEVDRAREMFLRSYQFTLQHSPSDIHDKYNSAMWYLQHFC